MVMIHIQKYIKFVLIILSLSCNSNIKEYKLFYDNGDIRVSGNFLNELPHGYWEGYYPNGQLKSSGEYYKGELIGRWIWYYEDGTIIKDSTYINSHFYD